MRRLLSAVLLLLGCREATTDTTAPRQLAGAAKGHNLVLLTLDTLRADRLGAYGYRVRPTSPHLDAQLASGILFERAMAQRASTWPSLASLLSGLYPRSHAVEENGYGFPDDLPTLPKLLADAGYETGAFLSNMCQANHQGWDAFACAGGQDGKTVARALEWAAALPADRPFFLWVHLFGAHGPYYNGGDLASTLDPGYSGPVGPKKWQLNRIMTERVALTPRDVRHLDALYDAAVVGSDRLSGNLLAGLAARGRMERTLLVVTADHGEELYDHHGYLYHACSVYQTTLHVPLGFVAPGLLPAGGRVAPTVELIDVLPTLLDLLAVARPSGLQGRSLLRYLSRPMSASGASGASGAGKPAFSEYGRTAIHTVLDGDLKLVVNPDGISPVCVPDAPADHYPIARAELYDLAADPGETVNLAARRPADVARLSGLIAQRFAAIQRRGGAQNIPEGLKEELEALGYVAH
jgi:arylsulfatase A-like enzyme